MPTINKDTAQHYKWGDGADGWHLLKSASLSIIQERVLPATSESRHYHRNAQQFFYVLSGTAHIEVEGTTHRLDEGNGLHVAAKQPHQLYNRGPLDLEFLVISEPASHADRIDVR